MRDLVLIASALEATYLPAETPVVLVGMGLVPSAVAATRAILERRPDRVVNLGSVGTLDASVQGIVRPRAVINRDVGVDTLRAMGAAVTDRIELGGGGPVLGSGDSFVAGGPEREALARRCQVVDMEGFAIAHACRELEVPLLMVKHVSDAADEGAVAWRELVDRSARALAAEYARIRDGG